MCTSPTDSVANTHLASPRSCVRSSYLQRTSTFSNAVLSNVRPRPPVSVRQDSKHFGCQDQITICSCAGSFSPVAIKPVQTDELETIPSSTPETIKSAQYVLSFATMTSQEKQLISESMPLESNRSKSYSTSSVYCSTNSVDHFINREDYFTSSNIPCLEDIEERWSVQVAGWNECMWL